MDDSFNMPSVSSTDDAVVTYDPPSVTRRTITVINEAPPASPIVEPVAEEVVVPVLDEPVPAAAAPLPKTGGLDPSLLYGLGLLLASGGVAIKRRNK